MLNGVSRIRSERERERGGRHQYIEGYARRLEGKKVELGSS